MKSFNFLIFLLAFIKWNVYGKNKIKKNYFLPKNMVLKQLPTQTLQLFDETSENFTKNTINRNKNLEMGKGKSFFAYPYIIENNPYNNENNNLFQNFNSLKNSNENNKNNDNLNMELENKMN